MSGTTAQDDFTPEEWDRIIRLAKRQDREEFWWSAALWLCFFLIAPLIPVAIILLKRV